MLKKKCNLLEVNVIFKYYFGIYLWVNFILPLIALTYFNSPSKNMKTSIYPPKNVNSVIFNIQKRVKLYLYTYRKGC